MPLQYIINFQAPITYKNVYKELTNENMRGLGVS